MAHWLTDLRKAVLDRLEGDTGSGGLLASGAELVSSVWSLEALPPTHQWWTTEGKTPEDPLIVFDIAQTGNADTQNSTGKAIQLAVSVYVPAESDTPDYDPLLEGGKIMDRIEGDWVAQGVGSAPTFGLDRYSSGALTGGYRLADPGWQLDTVVSVPAGLEWFEWEMTFSAELHKAGA